MDKYLQIPVWIFGLWATFTIFLLISIWQLISFTKYLLEESEFADNVLDYLIQNKNTRDFLKQQDIIEIKNIYEDGADIIWKIK